MGNALEIRLDGRLGSFRLAVDLALPMQGITALFGPSGCGKTSILRSVAGLHRIEGRIAIGGEIWQEGERMLPTHKRSLGYVFQEASLFQHLSVRRNLRFGESRARGADKIVRFDEIVELLGIRHLLDRMPHHLSGGERQRVSIGRALLSQPRLLLMDEPLSALDSMAKDEILPYLEALHARLKIPILLVTHDVSEVERLADHVVLLREGQVLGSGPLAEVQANPALPLAGSRDAAVTLDAVVAHHEAEYGLATLKVEGGAFTVPMRAAIPGRRLRLTVSAGDVSLALEVPRATTLLNILPARLLSAQFSDHEVSVVLGLGPDGDGSRILARVTRLSWQRLGLAEGMQVHAQVKGVALVRGQPQS